MEPSPHQLEPAWLREPEELQTAWTRDFHDLRYEWRRLFSEVLGTFLSGPRSRRC
jgi:hypothetical protein